MQEQLISGWGRYPVVSAKCYPVTTNNDLRVQLGRDFHGIGRGLGRSYGDSALAKTVLDLTGLDCIRSFDRQYGVIDCYAGVSLHDLLTIIVPAGWFLPVTPGTRYVTLGGAVASDVHGKNHHLDGCISAFVEQLEIMTADGSLLTCSEADHSELFHASCGGMGLTGVIVSVRLRLRYVRSCFIEQTTLRAENLRVALDLFNRHQGASYSVAWLDCLARGDNLGRSVVMLGEHSETGGLELQTRSQLTIPMNMPAGLLNATVVRNFNRLYYHKANHGQEKEVYFVPYFYPLDGLTHWNRLYGSKGFLQYQFVVPEEAALMAMTEVLSRISAAELGSFLCVLKATGPANANYLSFPLQGLSLALDFPYKSGLLPLLDELDAIVVDHGGRIYLAKDARMSAANFRRSYPLWPKFSQVREDYGAAGVFCSMQSNRLRLDE